MKSVIDLFKKSLNFPVIWVGVIYLFWWIFIPVDESFNDGIVLLAVYSVITVLERLSRANKKFSIILLIVLQPVTWVFSILWLDLWGSTTGWLGRELFHIPPIILFAGHTAYNLFRQSSNENKTVHTLLFITMLPILAMNIAYPITYFPEVLDRKGYKSFEYYLVLGMDTNYHSHISFYKCKEWNAQCNRHRTYFPMSFDKIIIDEEKNEVSAADGRFKVGLAFTYGDNPRSYDGDPVQLGDHIYQLSINHDYGSCEATGCDDYTYTAYECNLDYTSCDPLPIQYRATSDRWVYLDTNETKSEVNAYDVDDNLIFTYGKNPACYMDGCVILEK